MEAMFNFIPAPIALVLMLIGFAALAVVLCWLCAGCVAVQLCRAGGENGPLSMQPPRRGVPAAV
jgi:hypothetical protein